MTAEVLHSVFLWIWDILTSFQVAFSFSSISVLSVCLGVLQGRDQAVLEQGTGQAAGDGSLWISACSHTTQHFLSLLCSPSAPRNMMGWGLEGVPSQISKARREAGYSLPGCCVYTGICGVPWGTVTAISGKKCGSKLPSGLLAVRTPSAPRSRARDSGVDWDVCAKKILARL